MSAATHDAREMWWNDESLFEPSRFSRPFSGYSPKPYAPDEGTAFTKSSNMKATQ